jgi:hypothetical protein
MENSKGLRGAPLIRGKTSEKIRKSKIHLWDCKSRFFEQQFFMLFDALLTVVFENTVFNPTKTIQGTCLGPNLLKKCF